MQFNSRVLFQIANMEDATTGINRGGLTPFILSGRDIHYPVVETDLLKKNIIKIIVIK